MGMEISGRSAARFSVTGWDYILTSVTLAISGYGDNLRVRIAADDSGAPGATLDILSESQALWPNEYPLSAATTVSSSSNPVLNNGSLYWVVLEPVSGVDSDYLWHLNGQSINVDFWQQSQFGSLIDPSDPWSGFNGLDEVAFRVDGTAVPEPGSFALISLGLATMAFIRRNLRGRRD